jgi:transcriptional regulator with XRE-family HTH domain
MKKNRYTDKIPNVDAMTLGGRLKIFRLNILKSQRELSALADVGQACISSAEQNLSYPSFKLIAFLVDTENLNVKWLLSGMGEMKLDPLKPSKDIQPSAELRTMMQDVKTDPDLLGSMLLRYAELKKIQLAEDTINKTAGQPGDPEDKGFPPQQT